MAAPSNPLLVWANQDVILPNAQRPNKSLPETELVGTGWDLSQKPAADEWNYLLNNYGEYIRWLKDEKVGEFLQKSQNLADIGNVSTARTNLDVFSRVEVNSKTISAGSGLTGGGDLSVNRTISLGTPSTVGSGSGNTVTSTTHTHTLDATGNISILTGTISNGGTIPLPAGYTQAQCKWFVSTSDSNSLDIGWDLNESENRDHYRGRCSVDSNRLVSVYTTIWDGAPVTLVATANYIIIGVK